MATTYFATVLTNQGLSYINEAYPTGPLIDLQYFIPMYDYRIDPTITVDGIQLSAFSAVAAETVDLSVPVGEFLWKLPEGTGYDLSDNKALIKSIAGTYQFSSPTSTLINSIQTNNPDIGVNTFDSVPLSDTVFADTMFYDESTSTWYITGYSQENGSNNNPSETLAGGLYNVADYYPTSADNGLKQGSFICRINSRNGKFKFNKIALYCIRRNRSDGTLYNGDGAPVFFGEAYLQEPIIKDDWGVNGLDDITCKIQMRFTSDATDSDIFYSTTKDYWERGDEGVHYPFKVSIGDTSETNEIQAALHIKRPRSGINSTIDNTVPHLKIEYDQDNYVSFKYNSTKQLELDVNGMTSYSSSNGLTIKPLVNSVINLGMKDYEFRSLFVYTPDGQHSSPAITVNRGQVKIGKLPYLSLGYGVAGITLDDISVEIVSSSNKYGCFKGGDLWKANDDLIVFNSKSDSTLASRLLIATGVNSTSSLYTGWVMNHTTLFERLNILDEDDVYTYYKSTLLKNSELHIASKPTIKMFGVLELSNISDVPVGEANQGVLSPITYSTEHNDSIILTKRRSLIIAAGLNSNVTYDRLYFSTIERNDLTYGKDLVTYLSSTSDIYLAAKNIYVYGNIVPFKDKYSNIGSLTYRYNTIYSNQLDLGIGTNLSNNNGSNFVSYMYGLMLENGISYNGSNYEYLMSLVKRQDLSTAIITFNLGSSNSYVDNAYIDTLYIKNSNDETVELGAYVTSLDDNINTLLSGNGQDSLTTLTAASTVDIGSTYETFVVSGATAIEYISTVGRKQGNRIQLITSGIVTFKYNTTIVSDKASIHITINNIAQSNGSTIAIGTNRMITLIYNGTYWLLSD